MKGVVVMATFSGENPFMRMERMHKKIVEE